MSRNQMLVAAAALLGVMVLLCYGATWLFAGSRGPATDLLALARQGTSTEERQRAAVFLDRVGEPGRVALRELAAQSADPAVRATCVQGLGAKGDFESVELLLAAINDASPLVRARAKGALEKLWNRETYLVVEGSESQRAHAVAQWRAQWANLQRWGVVEHLRQKRQLAYFYDRNSGELFEALAELQAVETPSGPFQGQPAGVHAQVYCCGELGPPEARFVGYLYLTSAELKRQGGAVPAGLEPDEEVHVVALPGSNVWHRSDSQEGAAIVAGVAKRCPREKQPLPCSPQK